MKLPPGLVERPLELCEVEVHVPGVLPVLYDARMVGLLARLALLTRQAAGASAARAPQHVARVVHALPGLGPLVALAEGGLGVEGSGVESRESERGDQQGEQEEEPVDSCLLPRGASPGRPPCLALPGSPCHAGRRTSLGLAAAWVGS